MQFDLPWDRIAVIGALAEQFPKSSLGRTALMKSMYFLQMVRKVPLDYHFTLYSYGPYDTDVLDDLAYAEMLKVVEVASVQKGKYSGVEIRRGPSGHHLSENRREFLTRYQDDIRWVVGEFGRMSAAELELASTLVYARHEPELRTRPLSDVVKRVREVKPHFELPQIQGMADRLKDKRLLGESSSP